MSHPLSQAVIHSLTPQAREGDAVFEEALWWAFPSHLTRTVMRIGGLPERYESRHPPLPR